jgi:hypothetical protein
MLTQIISEGALAFIGGGRYSPAFDRSGDGLSLFNHRFIKNQEKYPVEIDEYLIC